MLRSAERGALVVADISGYTSFLAGTELEHAQDALRDLMSTVVVALRPQLKLVQLEGDAAFVYSLGERIDGSQLLDTLDATYFAFRRRLEGIARATTCTCDACVLIPALNLKLVAHHGEFVRQRMFGREELTGTDVIVVHRLLKNRVADQLKLSGYALLTDACVRAAGLDPQPLGLVEHREAYEQLGEMTGWVHDLERAWARKRELRRVRVTERDEMGRVSAVLPAPPATVWSYVTSPSERPRWVPDVVRVDQSVANGRRGVGTTNHCVHGEGVILEEVLDWRPFDYFTMRATMPGIGAGVTTYEFAPTDGGTAAVIRFQRPRAVKDRAMASQVVPHIVGLWEASLARLAEIIAAETAEPMPEERRASVGSQG